MNTIEAIHHRISANKFDTIRSLSEGERMDLDWTMMTIFGAHPPTPRARQDVPSDDPSRE